MSISAAFSHLAPVPTPYQRRKRNRPTRDLLEALAVPIFEAMVRRDFVRYDQLATEVGGSLNVVRTSLGKGNRGYGGADIWHIKDNTGHHRVQPCAQNLANMRPYLTMWGEMELRRRLEMTEAEVTAALNTLPVAERYDDGETVRMRSDEEWLGVEPTATEQSVISIEIAQAIPVAKGPTTKRKPATKKTTKPRTKR